MRLNSIFRDIRKRDDSLRPLTNITLFSLPKLLIFGENINVKCSSPEKKILKIFYPQKWKVFFWHNFTVFKNGKILSAALTKIFRKKTFLLLKRLKRFETKSNKLFQHLKKIVFDVDWICWSAQETQKVKKKKIRIKKFSLKILKNALKKIWENF